MRKALEAGWIGVIAAVTLIVMAPPVAAIESDWSEVAKAGRARLVAGTAGTAGQPGTYAAVEIELAKDWKTYWRFPGDAGGLPPTFDFSRSENVAAADVLYPAPSRFTDKSGHTIGYKDRVAFPVRLTAKDPGRPMQVRLMLQYGLCKDVCIPAEAEFALEVTADPGPLPEAAEAALARVPLVPEEAGSDAPRLKSVKGLLEGSQPKLVLEAQFPGGADGADIFLEAPDGLFVPLPSQTGTQGDVVLFEADLTDGADVAQLKGKSLTATLVSSQGQSTTTFKVE